MGGRRRTRHPQLAAARWDRERGSSEQIDAEWLRISAELTARFPMIGDREDCIVTVETPTRSGAPAAFYPTLAKVEVDREVFAGHAPATIRPARYGDEDRYPAAWGAFCHEGAHAAHTKWGVATTPDQRMTAAYAAADMLEECRAEHRHLGRRPGDLKYIRSCATDLVLEGMGSNIPDNAWSAGYAAGLILSRRDAGILEDHEVADLEAEVTKILGEDTVAELTEIWTAVRDTADDDHEAMLEHGRAWCQAVGHDPSQPDPKESEDESEDGQQPSIPGGAAPGTASGAPSGAPNGARSRRRSGRPPRRSPPPSPPVSAPSRRHSSPPTAPPPRRSGRRRPRRPGPAEPRTRPRRCSPRTPEPSPPAACPEASHPPR
ncbi:hypothetical protein ACFQ9X_31180 [Catenulispora yoronensis]